MQNKMSSEFDLLHSPMTFNNWQMLKNWLRDQDMYTQRYDGDAMSNRLVCFTSLLQYVFKKQWSETG